MPVKNTKTSTCEEHLLFKKEINLKKFRNNKENKKVDDFSDIPYIELRSSN